MIHAKPAVKEKKSMNSNTILLLLTIGLFVVMYAAGCIAYADKGFTKLQTFLDILKNNAGLICVTCGMTAVMITGGIDISVGAVIAMECMFLAVGVESWGLPAQLLIPLMLVIGVVFGIIQGYCVGYLGIQPFIVTMAGGHVLRPRHDGRDLHPAGIHYLQLPDDGAVHDEIQHAL